MSVTSSGGAGSVSWTDPPSRTVIPGIVKYQARLIKAIVALGRFFAARMQAYAKGNAPWTDRTSHARQGLSAVALIEATKVVIVLFHRMDYGVWLELANAGKYAIIVKTLEAHFPQIVAALHQLAGR